MSPGNPKQQFRAFLQECDEVKHRAAKRQHHTRYDLNDLDSTPAPEPIKRQPDTRHDWISTLSAAKPESIPQAPPVTSRAGLARPPWSTRSTSPSITRSVPPPSDSVRTLTESLPSTVPPLALPIQIPPLKVVLKPPTNSPSWGFLMHQRLLYRAQLGVWGSRGAAQSGWILQLPASSVVKGGGGMKAPITHFKWRNGVRSPGGLAA